MLPQLLEIMAAEYEAQQQQQEQQEQQQQQQAPEFYYDNNLDNYRKTHGLIMDSPDQIPSMRQIDEIANDIFVSDLPEPETGQSISLKEVFDIACSRYNLSLIFAREAITVMLKNPEVRQTKLITTNSYLSSSSSSSSDNRVINASNDSSSRGTATIVTDSSGSVITKSTVLDYRLSKKKVYTA